MMNDLQNFRIARFALDRTFDDVPVDVVLQLKRHLLDALGSFIHATSKPAIRKLADQITMMGEGGVCKTPYSVAIPYDRAAQLYTALIRYPDFMDNYLGKEATCHPSDNIGPLLAASQFRPTTGRDFLVAMAIAYQLECRLVEEIPVMKKGIDHTLLMSCSVVAGISRLLGLTAEQSAHALGIIGSTMSATVTSRASYTNEWKGFLSSLTAMNGMGVALLAKHGMTGPVALFEGPKGLEEVFGMKLDYDWDNEQFDLIRKCIIKRYNLEVHGQSVMECVQELMEKHSISATEIEKIDITTFLTAYNIIGSGEYGDRKDVETKEQADHSLFYGVAVLLLDGEISPEQFEPERISAPDVQQLLKKVFAHTGLPLHKPHIIAEYIDPYTKDYPEKMKCKVEIKMKSGKALTAEKEDYHGFFTRPYTWSDVVSKFKKLTADTISTANQEAIVETIGKLDTEPDMSVLIDLICNAVKDSVQANEGSTGMEHQSASSFNTIHR
jgi:2-methylcitrate dehydratase